MNKLVNNYNEFLLVREYSVGRPPVSKPEEKSEREKRLLFLVDHILDLTTYCEDYSLKIGETVLDIMKYINSKHYSLTTKSKHDYARKQWEFYYIVYVQFLIQYLEWGTSIWSAWFDSSKEIEGIKLTSQNVAKLIKWLDGSNE